MLATTAPRSSADLPAMGDIEKARRGAAIRRRRIALGINGYREFAEATSEAGIKDKGTVWRAENGTASDTTYDKLEAWLARQEAENGMTDPEPPTTLKVTMHNVYGVGEMIVEGPHDPDELAEAVSKILDRLQARDLG